MSTKLSIIIPSFKEGKIIGDTISSIYKKLLSEKIDFEIIIIDDNSNDKTFQAINEFSAKVNNIKFFFNPNKKGFGNSLKLGIEKSSGEYLCFVMADLSDSPEDIIKYYHTAIKTQTDCVFGDRWKNKDLVNNYPKTKYLFNRLGNKIISRIFNLNYQDMTNSFKLYKRDVILSIAPLISSHFSITIEIPLKVINRGYSLTIIENSWKNNDHSVSNFKISNIFFSYSLIVIYCFIENYFLKQNRN